MPIKCFTPAELKRYKKEGYDLEAMTNEQTVEFVNNEMLRLTNSQRQSKFAAVKLNSAWNKISEHPNGVQAGLGSFLYRDRKELFGGVSLDDRAQAVTNAAHSKIFAMMDELAPKRWGLDINKKQQTDMVYALFGEADKASDSRYQGMALKWNELIESLRVRFNKAGGDIKKLDDWALPQHHDAYLVSKEGFDNWYTKIIDQVDLEKMDIKLEDAPTVFKKAYDNIITEGVNDSAKGLNLGTSKIGNRHQKARFFKFKDADSWMAYQKEFSGATPYTAMMDHVQMITTEIALMEQLGPNPDMAFKNLASMVEKKEGPGKADNVKKAYDNLAGHLNATTSRRRLSDSVQSLKNIVTGLKLPGAAIAALGDIPAAALTASYNNLPAMKVMKRYLGNLNPASKGDRVLAEKLWFSLDHMLDEAHAAMRFSDVTGRGATSRFSASIMRGSGLSAMTVAMKKAFHYEFMNVLGSGTYEGRLLKAFDRYGISAEDQAIMKASKKIKRGNLEYLDPSALPQDVAERVVGMITAETKMAVPEGDLLTRSIMNQGLRKGEFGREALGLFTQFKTFPVTIMAGHWQRALHGFEGNKADRIAYIAAYVTATTAMGALVIQAKEIMKGNTARDYDTAEFWKDASLQGGSASLLGDILSSDSRSFGTSMQEFIMGPTASVANNILWKGVGGSKDALMSGEKNLKDIAMEATGGAADYVPYQFWYTKAIMDRVILDSMRKLGDPKWELKQAKKQAERQQKYGNERYW